MYLRIGGQKRVIYLKTGDQKRKLLSKEETIKYLGISELGKENIFPVTNLEFINSFLSRF